MFKFMSQLFITFTQSLFEKPKDNHDFHRFPETATMIPLVQLWKNKLHRSALWLLDIAHFIFNLPKFSRAYQLLADTESKNLFIRLIVYKILGPKYIQIKPHCNWHVENQLLDWAQQFYIAPSQLALKPHPVFGALNHYQYIPTAAEDISLDCWAAGITYMAGKKQYYFERHGTSIKPEAGDYVIDGGGCFGDTSVFFAKSVGERGKIYVFDPLAAHGKVIHQNIAQNNLSRHITYLPYALGEFSNHVAPKTDDKEEINPGFRLSDESHFPIIRIDEFMQHYSLNKMDFIKMDIEGHELAALKGALKTIKQFKPKLAISIYHRKEDFYAIPLWIHEACKEYRFYLDHYTLHAEETVLYVTTEPRPVIA